ncbi:3-phosphoshikimate 1-carboxyvinyltransferase [Kordia sp. YSTF-M3]|uniref:3-phosphoshikimate 1-carboxyvinyltransferase n=1 Tax=Kordia aestuariivivens TaxID=2759037 RepID=A0ABR7Q426_9FLAO|nr:3-phosphoshikimate 1-carboxyvinyltransferase [Kordia aestuariivivens]MBC8753302.1 3-phosphoshikimate 1-carboxyvinyltransferase [Kordia aestuariivivens]
MNIKLQKSTLHKQSNIAITGSKSESNRLLLLQALYPNITIANISNSDDAVLMQKALKSSDTIKDIHHAGTAMRFLTAYYATQNRQEITLTGSARMQERPIKILVEALRQLGADIQYTNNEGYPPLQIKGQKLQGNKVTLDANISSQYISALLLIAPTLENGLTLSLNGKITSVPYINMTLSLLNDLGVKTHFEGNTITVQRFEATENVKAFTVESDWSSASYFYSLIALSEIGTTIELSSYKENSLQGDSCLAEIYKEFGVETVFAENTITLSKKWEATQEAIKLDLKNAPDIAQTIAVTAFGLKLSCNMIGLHTLKIKETDRLVALKTELEKLGASVDITDASLHLHEATQINENIIIETYKDHRMAMAFAPLALRVPLEIEKADVVSKSFPDFWKDLQNIGIKTV